VGDGTARSSNIYINVTPFVDMMTILVTFLLMVFSGSELARIEQGLELPETIFGEELRTAPVITITQNNIKVDQKIVVDNLSSIIDTRGSRAKFRYAPIPALRKRLEEKHIATQRLFDQWKKDATKPNEKAELKRCETKSTDPTEFCLRDLMILQADRRVPAVVINRVMASAKNYSQTLDRKPMYRQFMFVIKKTGRE
jgi:hypothetical protein